jgi:hypothetical protein
MAETPLVWPLVLFHSVIADGALLAAKCSELELSPDVHRRVPREPPSQLSDNGKRSREEQNHIVAAGSALAWR